MTFRYSLQS